MATTAKIEVATVVKERAAARAARPREGKVPALEQFGRKNRIARSSLHQATCTVFGRRGPDGMMWRIFTLLTLTMGGIGVVVAGQPQTASTNGSYEVGVRLELPHLEEWAVKKRATICISDGHRTRGLTVLSDNNPLARCPASNVRWDGNSLTFDIVCEGRDAARASAKFRLMREEFRGRIAMVMGGKNMTMTETQIGRRIGTCPSGR
jgi:hypothetical protein